VGGCLCAVGEGGRGGGVGRGLDELLSELCEGVVVGGGLLELGGFGDGAEGGDGGLVDVGEVGEGEGGVGEVVEEGVD
jgi:hypothetical protein